ncbi:DEAD/DEAH box helicase, partial [Pantoea vagans]
MMSKSQSDTVLARFSPAIRRWFSAAFAAPTPVQKAAWQAIASGEHALVIAPTGSGKTLAAFLTAIDTLF